MFSPFAMCRVGFYVCWTGGGKVNEEICDDIDKVESV